MKALLILACSTLIILSCKKEKDQDCGKVVSIKTEQPIGDPIITVTVTIKYASGEEDMVIREDADKYPYTYWQEKYLDAVICK